MENQNGVDNGNLGRVAWSADGLVYGSCDPVWGVIHSGERVEYQQPVIADHRGPNEDEFLVSKDGGTVFFGFGYGDNRPAVFSVRKRSLREGRPDNKLYPPLLQKGEMRVRDWENENYPELNGQRLELKDYETSCSLAVAPDGERFVLGADWHIYCFDKSGERIWRTPVPGTAWGVNIARCPGQAGAGCCPG